MKRKKIIKKVEKSLEISKILGRMSDKEIGYTTALEHILQLLKK